MAGKGEDTGEDANFSYNCACLLSHERSREVMVLGGSPRGRRGRLGGLRQGFTCMIFMEDDALCF